MWTFIDKLRSLPKGYCIFNDQIVVYITDLIHIGNKMKFLNFTLGFIALALFVFILSIGKKLILPLVIALILFFIIINVASKYRTIKIKGKNLNHPLSIFASIATSGLVIWFLSYIINTNIANVIDATSDYQYRLENILNTISYKVGYGEPVVITDMIKNFDMSNLLSGFASAVATFAGSMTMVLIYLLFMFLESKNFKNKLHSILEKMPNNREIREIFSEINSDINRYLGIKFFSSLATGILSYIVLVLIGVDFANFWALLIFLLNFIPTVGSIVATIFPTLITLVQFNSIYPFIIVSVMLISIQITIGTILEPRFMGKSLNLSPLVILLSLALWGKIWGVLGMFLSVPIMVSINIVLANFPATKPIAVILSSDGEIE